MKKHCAVTFLMFVFFSLSAIAERVTFRLGEHFIGFQGISREDVSIALREELRRRLIPEQQPSGAAAATSSSDSWNAAITKYQNNLINSYDLTRAFDNQQTGRRQELLQEVSQLRAHGILTYNFPGWYPAIYYQYDNGILLRTEPTENLKNNARIMEDPGLALSNVLNAPAQYTLQEALIATHSYLLNSYREARRYAHSLECDDLVSCAPQRFWEIQDLVLIIHIMNKNTSTAAGSTSASTPLSQLDPSLMFNLEHNTHDGNCLSFSQECLNGQPDLNFDRYTELVLVIVKLYKECLLQSQNDSNSEEIGQVIADLDLLMQSMSPEFIRQ